MNHTRMLNFLLSSKTILSVLRKEKVKLVSIYILKTIIWLSGTDKIFKITIWIVTMENYLKGRNFGEKKLWRIWQIGSKTANISSGQIWFKSSSAKIISAKSNYFLKPPIFFQNEFEYNVPEFFTVILQVIQSLLHQRGSSTVCPRKNRLVF